MVCAEPSPIEIGMMAESNVGAVMLKPFTFENFRNAVHKALQNKVSPSPYWKMIEEGKEQYERDALDSAIPLFEKSKSLDPKPVLAFYYRGQIHRKKTEFKQAIQNFETGLSFDPKDYHCLTAVFDTRMQCSEFDLAYQAATALHQNYPVGTTRILDLVKLSVYGKRYEEIVNYYQIFKKMEKREPDLVRAVIAGMLICAKHLTLGAKRNQGLEILQNAAKVALDSNTLNLEVFRYFIESGFHDEGEKYFGSLSEEIQKQNETQVLYLEMIQATKDPASVVQVASQILGLGVKSPRIYEILIENSKKIGRSSSVIEGLLHEAKATFPEKF